MAQDKPPMEYGKRNALTGDRWVHVSREAARAHPKGQMHWSFWLIGLWLLVVSGMRFRLGLDVLGLGWTLAAAILPGLVGILVLMRAPVARVLLIVTGVMTIYSGVRNIGAGNGIYQLIEILIMVSVIIYMWEGERPNLAYGYRFRSRRTDQEIGDG